VSEKFFAADGSIADEKAAPYAKKIMDSFATWVEQLLK
jgi:hypothetical protein